MTTAVDTGILLDILRPTRDRGFYRRYFRDLPVVQP